MREKVKKKSVIHKCLRLVVLAGVFVVAGIPVQGMGALTAKAASTTINSTNFPDANFRAYVTENFDTDGDGRLSDAEKNAVTDINVSRQSISSMVGVENFKNLQELYCYSTQISSLDVSKNTALKELFCSDTQISSLDVSQNTKLTKLGCSDLRISSLDVSKNIALEYLNCSSTQISSLDVSKNIALEYLYCSNTQISSLDVSENTALKELYCYSTQISSLDVSKNTALIRLGCSDLRINSLDVSKNIALEYLSCSKTQISSLDVSKNTALEVLGCSSTQISSLDVSKNIALTELQCVDTRISSLDVSKNCMLSTLNCYGNQFSNGTLSFDTAGLNGFDLSRASNWSNATISDTVVTAVDVTHPVTYLYDCGNNYFKTFMFSPTQTYTVTFNANGGSCTPASKNVTYGYTYGTLPTPTRTGYRFAGWYTSASGGSQVTSSKRLSSPGDRTLYAHWTANAYTVTFNANGGSSTPASKDVIYGNIYGTLPTPIRKDYTFSGWYTELSGGSQVTGSTTMLTAANNTLFAHWIKNEESQTGSETTGGGQQVQKPSNPGAIEKRDNKLKTPAKQNNKKRVEKANISLESATGVTKADQYMVLGKTKVSKKKLVLKLKTSGVKIQKYKSSNKKVATVNKRGLVKLKKIGKTTITVTAIVTATGKKILKKYTLTVNPDKTVLESVQSKVKGKVVIKWKQNSSGDGYEIYRSLSRNFKDDVRTYKIPGSKETVSTITDLIPGAKYYIKVRSYKLVSGKPYYGAWSKVKTVKVR